jgi:cytochrome c-type biogenesis protein CcmH
MVVAGALVAAAVALTVVALRPAHSKPSLQDRVRAVASTLRCPVCQDLSVADSPSGLARQMRAQIAADLRAGEPPDRVRADFVRAYGDWILLAPPRHGLNLVVWVGPAVLLLAGLGLVGLAVRRWTVGGSPGSAPERGPSERVETAPISEQDRRLLDRAMAADGFAESLDDR